MYYFGFDLGDGESCIHYSEDPFANDPITIPISGENSFLSAVGMLDGKLIVGKTVKDNVGNVEDAHVCFKCHFLEHKSEYDRIIRDFVRGTMTQLRKDPQVGDVVDDENQACFIVGCPAGWKPEERERYKTLMVNAGIRNVKLVSESWAAIENALRDKENGLDTDITKQTILVIDIGSSTLDFAYIKDGNEYKVESEGNVRLGGGMLDEMIVLRSLELQERDEPDKVDIIRQTIENNDSAKSRLMMKAREIKEEYFRREKMFLARGDGLDEQESVYSGGVEYKAALRITPEIVQWLITHPHPLLNDQSFDNRLRNSLLRVHHKLQAEQEPDVVILTGGASRMQFFQDLCKKEFSESRVIVSKRPEFDISRGLVFIGGVDKKLSECIKEIRDYVNGDSVEQIVEKSYSGLIEDIYKPMTGFIMNHIVKQSFRRWKNGALKTLNDFEGDVRDQIQSKVSQDNLNAELGDKVRPWSRDILGEVNMNLTKICRKYDVHLSFTDELIAVPVGGEYAGPKIRFDFIEMINNFSVGVVSIVFGALAGGGGLALIMAGPVGFAIGALIGLITALINRSAPGNLIKNMNIPLRMRRLISENSLLSRRNIKTAEKKLHDEMLANKEIKEEIVREVSKYIDATIADKVRMIDVSTLSQQ